MCGKLDRLLPTRVCWCCPFNIGIQVSWFAFPVGVQWSAYISIQITTTFEIWKYLLIASPSPLFLLLIYYHTIFINGRYTLKRGRGQRWRLWYALFIIVFVHCIHIYADHCSCQTKDDLPAFFICRRTRGTREITARILRKVVFFFVSRYLHITQWPFLLTN